MSEKPVRTFNGAYIASVRGYLELSDEEAKAILLKNRPPADEEISEEEYQRISKMSPSEILEEEFEELLSSVLP
jgi:hypothetical protein